MPSEAKPDQQMRIREQDGGIVLHPSDDDLFVRTGRQIIAACRLKISLDTWLQEFAAAREEVREWTGLNVSRSVVSVYCLNRSGVAFMFVTPGREFDTDLADELAKFSLSLHRKYNVGMIELGQVPEYELRRFVDPQQAKLVYGK